MSIQLVRTKDWSSEEREFVRGEIERLRPWSFSFDFGGDLTTRQGIDPRPKFQTVLRFLPRDLDGKSCLDIGCNNGQLGMMLKDRNAGRVVGVDHDARGLKQAELLHQTFGYEIETLQMDATDLPGDLGTFDYVFCLGVLYHLTNMHAMMCALHALTGETCLIETEVLARDYDPDCALFIEREYRSDRSNWWIPGVGCVMAMARAAGFRGIELITYRERTGSAFTREGLRNQARGFFRATPKPDKLLAPRLEVREE